MHWFINRNNEAKRERTTGSDYMEIEPKTINALVHKTKQRTRKGQGVALCSRRHAYFALGVHTPQRCVRAPRGACAYLRGELLAQAQAAY